MVVVLPWTTDSYAAGKGNSAIFFWKLKVHQHIQRSLQTDSLLIDILFSQRFKPKIMYKFLVSPYIWTKHIILTELISQKQFSEENKL